MEIDYLIDGLEFVSLLLELFLLIIDWKLIELCLILEGEMYDFEYNEFIDLFSECLK